MKKAIFIFSILLITTSINAQQKNNSNKTDKSRNNLVLLTKNLADLLCVRIAAEDGSEPIEKTVRETLVNSKLIPKDATKSDIGNFINNNFNKLRCKNDPTDMNTNEQHIHERAFDDQILTFFSEIILNEDYKVDINKIIKHNGKEFTLLDHINYIIKNESHNFDEKRLNSLKNGIKEAIEYSLEEN